MPFESRLVTPKLSAVVWGISKAGMYKYLLPRVIFIYQMMYIA
jgi:hypothetical protein